MFTNRMIRNLLVPVVLEQILNSIMGTADTMMVSNVGSAALSAVSLVDSINVLLIQAFSALAAGGAIVCQAGAFYHHSDLCSGVCSLSDLSEAAFEADLRCSGCGCYACIGNLFLFHGTVIPLYCGL